MEATQLIGQGAAQARFCNAGQRSCGRTELVRATCSDQADFCGPSHIRANLCGYFLLHPPLKNTKKKKKKQQQLVCSKEGVRFVIPSLEMKDIFTPD